MSRDYNSSHTVPGLGHTGDRAAPQKEEERGSKNVCSDRDRLICSGTGNL